MGQKTHPIGYRLGIDSKSITPAYSLSDVHGLNSRWTVSNTANVSKYADTSHRDRTIKKIVEEFIEEDGYLVNKVIIHRSNSYTGVYVDAIELQEPRQYHISQLQISRAVSKPSLNTTVLENHISHHIEGRLPVIIQFVTLNHSSHIFNAASMRGVKTHVDNSKNKSRSEADLINVASMLTKDCIPCSSLLAKLITLNMSFGGRRERQTMRLISKLMGDLIASPVGRVGKVTPNYDKGGSSSGSKRSFKGYLIKFKGRIGGSERSRTIRYRSGALPRHTVSAAIDYGFSEVNTVSGKVSVTVMSYFS